MTPILFYIENELLPLLENAGYMGLMGTVKVSSRNSNKTSFEYDIKKGDVDE
ncbi:MAG: phage holin family protein [Bacillus cereus]|jgi:phage-related holin|nr:phage holin family protein [Bacillus cereus]